MVVMRVNTSRVLQGAGEISRAMEHSSYDLIGGLPEIDAYMERLQGKSSVCACVYTRNVETKRVFFLLLSCSILPSSEISDRGIKSKVTKSSMTCEWRY